MNELHEDTETKPPLTMSRRTLLSTSVAAVAFSSTGLSVFGQTAPQMGIGSTISPTFAVNGVERSLGPDPRSSLLDTLRENLELFGTKKGCGHGQCGACTVHIDGKRVVSCLTPAVQASGRDVTTIEGIAEGENLHVMQQAFIDNDALQCGYCTPGQIMSAIACVNEGHAGSADEVREYMSGNLCRCGAYEQIVAAVLDAKTKMEA